MKRILFFLLLISVTTTQIACVHMFRYRLIEGDNWVEICYMDERGTCLFSDSIETVHEEMLDLPLHDPQQEYFVLVGDSLEKVNSMPFKPDRVYRSSTHDNEYTVYLYIEPGGNARVRVYFLDARIVFMEAKVFRV